MYKIAGEITQMTDEEMREYECPRLHSRDQINSTGPMPQNVRIAAGLIVTADENDTERAMLEKRRKEILHKFGFPS